MNRPENFEDYISSFPQQTQLLLIELQSIIKKNAPDAQEIISYSMPAFKFYGNLVYFAAFKNHIGFYPMPSAVTKFKDELIDYQTSKSTIQFLLDRKLPVDLISKIVQFRVAENLEKHNLKMNKKNKVVIKN